jgi:hypothetical protein
MKIKGVHGGTILDRVNRKLIKVPNTEVEVECVIRPYKEIDHIRRPIRYGYNGRPLVWFPEYNILLVEYEDYRGSIDIHIISLGEHECNISQYGYDRHVDSICLAIDGLTKLTVRI